MGDKKRKRGEGGSSEVTVKNYHDGMVVATTFGGQSVPKDASFNVYKRKSDVIVHGENPVFEYDGQNQQDQGSYCLASYDPGTNSVELYPSSLVNMAGVVKAKKMVEGPAVKQANVRNVLQRNALGEAFGTKKAKKAITEMERNRIDAEKLEDLEVAIVDTVQESTENLPSQEKRQEALSSTRPIPPHNLETTKVEEVYPLDGIIPKFEWSYIRVQPITQEKDLSKKLSLFPHKTSQYVSSRMAAIENGVGTQTEKIKMIYYASLLLAVYENKRINNKAALLAKVGNPPEALISGILDRFAVSKASQFGKTKDRNFAIDPVHEHKLLCYLLALILRIDNYTAEIAPLAQELSLKPSKLAELFRALGCAVKPPTAVQAEALGLSKAAAANYKLAVLSAPLKLPDVAKRKRQGGR
jgi:DNA-directed RNA polymerase I subunit RPA49